MIDNIGNFVRGSLVEGLKEEIGKSESIFVVQYSGLASNQMSNLRKALRSNQSRLLVTKNTLIRRALAGAQAQGLEPLIDGQVALIFGYSDIAAASKALTAFVKENQSLVLKGGVFRSRILSKEDINAIAKLPSREVLLGQLVAVLMSPLSGLVYTLKGNLNKLVVVLNQIKEKKQ